MRRASFRVEDDGSTPEKPLVACLYCAAPVGSEHEKACVMRRRTAVLRVVFERAAEIPEHWTPEDVARYHNEGSWCASLGNLRQTFAISDDTCLCRVMRIEFVREATEQDEEESGVRVADFTD